MMMSKRYDFSYTGFSLRVNDMARVAEALEKGENIDFGELGEGKARTGKNRFNEISKRLKRLTAKQTAILIDGEFPEQRHIAFLAVCKAHLFIRDFSVEVLREKLLLSDHRISEGDYVSFFRRKADLYPEMESLTESTKKKIRQVTFKILEQAGIIDHVRQRAIQPQFPTPKVIQSVTEDNTEWLKVLLMNDPDLENLN